MSKTRTIERKRRRDDERAQALETYTALVNEHGAHIADLALTLGLLGFEVKHSRSTASAGDLYRIQRPGFTALLLVEGAAG